MRNIQLAYLFILDSETGLSDIHLNFSDKFNFNIYNSDKENINWKVLITKKEVENCVSSKFWGEGEHISRIDLIVGQNGSGKSTILSCIEGIAEGIYFTIYCEEIDGKLQWFFKPCLNYKINVEIVESWNRDKIIIPNELWNEPFESIYKSNVFTQNWICNDVNDEEYGIKGTNKPASIYKFVTKELAILEKYFPAEDLVYGFFIPLESSYMIKLLKTRNLPDYYRYIFYIAIYMMKYNNDRRLDIEEYIDRYKFDERFSNIDETYLEYLSYKDSLLVSCFRQSEYSLEIINLLKMNIYISFLIHLSENIKDYNKLDNLVNIKSIEHFNEFLRDELIYIIDKLDDENKTVEVVKKYIKFDFVEKLFLLFKKKWINIKVVSSDSINFEIFLSRNLNLEKDDKIIEIINFTHEIKDINNKSIISLKRVGFCNLSSGEMAYLDLFAGIYNIFFLNQTRDEEEEFEYQRYKNAQNYLFILDEPEGSFHPEWSRKLIYYITSFIDNLLEGTNKRCQFIISTHSPFIVSDIPSNYIKCISLNIDNRGNRIRVISEPSHSFAANIYEILNNGFFMDAPIGEFAQNKIQDIILKIDELEEMKFDKIMSEKDSIYNMIDIIDDKLIRNRLKNMFKEKEEKIINKDSPILIGHLMKEITNLKEEISELKNIINNRE